MGGKPISIGAAIEWLEEAAVYFGKRPTNGEDSTFWANAYNAENAHKIADMLRSNTDFQVVHNTKETLTAQGFQADFLGSKTGESGS